MIQGGGKITNKPMIVKRESFLHPHTGLFNSEKGNCQQQRAKRLLDSS